MTNIVLNRRDFIKVLNIGGVFAGKSKVLPILDCVKIKVKKDCMNVISCDNENAISKRMKFIESSFEGEFCLGLKSFVQYIKLINSETVELLIDDDMRNIHIKHEYGEMTLPIVNADNFPLMNTENVTINIDVDAYLLNNWIVDARGFTTQDTLQPQLECILIYKKGEELGCAASDGTKLFCDYINVNSGDDFEYLINKNAFSAICSVCTGCEMVSMKIGDSNTVITGGDTTIIARNVVQKYPNFKSILTEDNDVEVIVNKTMLKEAICRCMVGASQATSLLRFDLNGSSLNLSAEDVDFSVRSVENLTVNGKGNITIGFKADYIIDILNTISTDKVVIKLKDCSRPAFFQEECGNPNKLSILMPMML